MKYLIGIDGGGTKTIGYIGNYKGEILGSVVVGPSNYHSVGLAGIGRMVLNSVFKAYDGREEKTSLSESILEYLNVDSIDSLIKYIYKDLNSKAHIAKLAPLALKGALNGDQASINILNKAADSLVLMTETVIKKLSNNIKELCLMGGVGALILAWIKLGLNYDISQLKIQMKEVKIYE